MKFKSITAISSGLLVATIALHGAQAQTKEPRVVSRDELRSCMNSETEVVARRRALEARKEKNAAEGEAIRVETEELTEEEGRIGQNQGRMDRYERRVKVHNDRIKAANAGIASFTSDLEAFRKDLAAYNELCSFISFKPEDKEAILKERESATK